MTDVLALVVCRAERKKNGSGMYCDITARLLEILLRVSVFEYKNRFFVALLYIQRIFLYYST